MEIKILQEKKNALFSRNEVKIEVKNEVTPSKEESKKIIAKKFKVDESLIRIRDIIGKFGVSVFVVTVDIYDSIEEFNRIVKKTKQELEAEKNILEEKKKAEEETKAAEEEAKKAEKEAKVVAKVETEKPTEETSPDATGMTPGKGGLDVPSNGGAEDKEVKEEKVEEKSE